MNTTEYTPGAAIKAWDGFGAKPSPLVIYVQPRTVYGEQKIYPACHKADQFAAIAGTATLTDRTIKAIKALGYSIEIVHQVVTL